MYLLKFTVGKSTVLEENLQGNTKQYWRRFYKSMGQEAP